MLYNRFLLIIYFIHVYVNHILLEHQFPTFLAPGTSFMEDSFSTDEGQGDGLGMIQTLYIYYATTDMTGGGTQAVMQAMVSSCKYR